jgi:hypothetical protein
LRDTGHALKKASDFIALYLLFRVSPFILKKTALSKKIKLRIIF